MNVMLIVYGVLAAIACAVASRIVYLLEEAETKTSWSQIIVASAMVFAGFAIYAFPADALIVMAAPVILFCLLAGMTTIVVWWNRCQHEYTAMMMVVILLAAYFSAQSAGWATAILLKAGALWTTLVTTLPLMMLLVPSMKIVVDILLRISESFAPRFFRGAALVVIVLSVIIMLSLMLYVFSSM